MAYVWRLQYAVPGLQDKRWALIFIHNFHPAFVAVDHLKFDVVMVHVVGNRAAVLDTDVRGDVTAAETTRNQVAILHTRASPAPIVICRTAIMLEADTKTVSRKLGNARRVRREDQVHPESEFFGIEVECCCQVDTGQHDFFVRTWVDRYDSTA